MGDYGMIFVLLLLCLLFSVLTWNRQNPEGADAARLVCRQVRSADAGAIIVIGRNNDTDREFTAAAQQRLESSGWKVTVVNGEPSDARRALNGLVDDNQPPKLIVCNRQTADWGLIQNLPTILPALADISVIAPESYMWPSFLKRSNLLNIANQIAVIAIIAIGMTMVIITAGIDLSVGSLIALSAVLATLYIRDTSGALNASVPGMFTGCLLAILFCGLVGLFTGIMVTAFRITPFIVTLAMMQVTSGMAYIWSKGESIYEVPESFTWLGRGADLAGIPNAVLLMLLLYIVAHVVMTQTVLGRHIYAVGGNKEAARLSGVPVNRVLLIVYTICGLLAGLGGVIMASLLRSGSPTYGQMYELYVIAAVVVGGTSLMGGEGKIFGTLIGAFIIAVIQNGMNLTNVESYTQRVVLGAVILIAVLIDRFKQGGWQRLRQRFGRSSSGS